MDLLYLKIYIKILHENRKFVSKLLNKLQFIVSFYLQKSFIVYCSFYLQTRFLEFKNYTHKLVVAFLAKRSPYFFRSISQIFGLIFTRLKLNFTILKFYTFVFYKKPFKLIFILQIHEIHFHRVKLSFIRVKLFLNVTK